MTWLPYAECVALCPPCWRAAARAARGATGALKDTFHDTLASCPLATVASPSEHLIPLFVSCLCPSSFAKQSALRTLLLLSFLVSRCTVSCLRIASTPLLLFLPVVTAEEGQGLMAPLFRFFVRAQRLCVSLLASTFVGVRLRAHLHFASTCFSSPSTGPPKCTRVLAPPCSMGSSRVRRVRRAAQRLTSLVLGVSFPFSTLSLHPRC